MSARLLLAGVALVGVIYAGFWARRSNQISDIQQVDAMGKATGVTGLKHFSALEFGAWWPMMNLELLQKLDNFRDAIGMPVIISPAAGSLGRAMSESAESQHNITRYGEVRAADVMFPTATPDMMHGLYLMARSAGFTGIGAYPDWKPYMGMHLDVRDNKAPGNPATWSGIKTTQGQKYFAVERAFA